MALTDKQLAFCVEYLVDYNATQAAIRAGYSEKTARKQASDLLAKRDISGHIAKLRGEVDDSVLRRRHDVLTALEQIIFTSPADYCTLGADGLWCLNVGPESDDAHKMAIKSVTSRTTEAGAVISKVECHDKLKAIDMYCRLRGWLTKDVNLNVDARKQTINLMMPENGKRNDNPKPARGSADSLSTD